MPVPEKTAVAWCAGCFEQGEGLYLPVEDAGTICPSEDCGRTLRRRVGYICKAGCENQQIYFDRKDFLQDQADHEYEARIGPMPALDLAALRRAAVALDGERWSACLCAKSAPDGKCLHETYGKAITGPGYSGPILTTADFENDVEVIDFVALANPRAILALLDYVAKLEAAVRATQGLPDGTCAECEWDAHVGYHNANCGLGIALADPALAHLWGKP